MTVLHVANRASVVDDAQVERMVAAVETQLRRDVAPAWGITPVPVRFARRVARPRPGDFMIIVMDDADNPEDAGWHVEARGGVVYGRVSARPCLVHLNPDPMRSVASTLSHEVLETVLDPTCAYWADSRKGFLVAREICDPVEDIAYRIGRVWVSDFVYPGYFDPDAESGSRLDHMGVLSHPFQLSKGGYWMQRKGTRTSEVEGERFPAWRRRVKAGRGTRPSRRLRAGAAR